MTPSQRGTTAVLLLLLLASAIAQAQHQDQTPQGVNINPYQGTTPNYGSPDQFVQEMVDAVSRDSLKSYISELQAFGTRFEYTPQRDSAAAYILRELDQFGIGGESNWYAFGTNILYDLERVSHDSIWIVGTGGLVVATTDGGQTWHSQNNPLSSDLYGVGFRNHSVGCGVGQSGTIIHTTDAGSTWSHQGSPVSTSLYDIGYVNEQVGIIVGTNGVVLQSTDGGAKWRVITSGTNARLRRLEVLDTANIWSVGDAGTIIHSPDGGGTWEPQVSGTASQLYGVDFVTPNLGWAVGQGPTLLKTTDGGKTWTSIGLRVEWGTFWTSISFQDSLRGWALDYSGIVLRSTDGGYSWSPIYNHLNLGWGPSLYTITANNDGQVICCGDRGTLSASEDDGVTWGSLTGNLPQEYLHTSRNIIATIPGQVSPEKECIIVAHYDSYSSDAERAAPGANDNASGTSAVMEAARLCRVYAFESTIHFIAVSAEEYGMYGSSNYAMAARDQKRPIVAAINGDMIGYPVTGDTARLVIGSYLTRNRLIDSALAYNARYNIGLTLVPLIDQTGASDYGPFAMAGYDALDVAEATADEIWGGADPYYHKPSDTIDKLSLGMVRRATQLMLATVAELAVPVGRSTSVPPTAVTVPEHFALHQNYPNPFNPTTSIQFTIVDRQSTIVKVYDVLGREVATLVNEPKTPGTYVVQFDASDLASGVYLARLTAGEFVKTIRMLLVR